MTSLLPQDISNQLQLPGDFFERPITVKSCKMYGDSGCKIFEEFLEQKYEAIKKFKVSRSMRCRPRANNVRLTEQSAYQTDKPSFRTHTLGRDWSTQDLSICSVKIPDLCIIT